MGQNIDTFCDANSGKFRKLLQMFEINNDVFIRTTQSFDCILYLKSSAAIELYAFFEK